MVMCAEINVTVYYRVGRGREMFLCAEISVIFYYILVRGRE